MFQGETNLQAGKTFIQRGRGALCYLIPMALLACTPSVLALGNCFYFRGGSEYVCVPTDPITVPTAPLESMDKQIAYQFETRVGDINSDGRKDIFIKRKTGVSNNGVIYRNILTAQADGSFKVLAASSYQLNSASSWPLKAIDIINNDFNLDGYVDIMLKNVGQHISGATDQMVFSNKQSNGRAKTATKMDSNFKQFFSNMANYAADDSFFSNNSHSELITYRYPMRYCSYSYGEFRCFCYWYSVSIPVIRFDPSVISREALLAGLHIDAVGEGGNMGTVVNLFESLMDVDIAVVKISDYDDLVSDSEGKIPGLLEVLDLIGKIETIVDVLSTIAIGVDIVTGPSGEAAIIVGGIRVVASKATKKAFEKMLAQNGRKSLERARRSIQKNLDEHLEKLEKLKEDGKYTSSVEREIRTFKSQLEAIDDILREL